MKLIALLFLFNLQVTASVYSQRISLTATNTPLREVLQTVRKQSGYSFFVESDNLRDSKPVNLSLMENSVPEALDKIFENQPFTYTIENNVIVVTRKLRTNLSAADFLTFDNGGPDSTKVVYVQGSVRDDKGQPLVGVSIRIKGGGTGTVTKADGTYSLKTNAAATLVFSYIGYLSREIKASQGEVDVVLKQLNTALDQVQVIAYGTTTKRFSTGNIATVSAEVIERQPVSNPLLALQGRVPGMFIQQMTGNSAGNVIINIQGINSLAQGTSPFFVIDGVPFPPVNSDPTMMSGAISGNGGSTLTYINPSDIESITVLKDADATSIYGSRAANGAILITTKKGKPGNTRVDVDLQTSWGKIPRQIKMLNSQEYIALRKEAKKNDNAAITVADFDINGDWDTTRYTNWQKELVGGTSHLTNMQAGLSGGTDRTQFLIKGGYLKETTVYPGDQSATKENVHISLNHRSSNQKFSFNFSGTYLQDDNKMINTDLMINALLLVPPLSPPLYNNDGSLNWGYSNRLNTYTFSNPLGPVLLSYQGNTNNTIANADISYRLLEGLELNTSLGYNKIQNTEILLTPQSAFTPRIVANLRSSSIANKTTASWIIEPKIKYKKDFNSNRLEILIGSTFQQNKNDGTLVRGRGFTNDAQIVNIANAPIISAIPYQILYRYEGVFGRINMNTKDKYIITLAGRRDGSSRFGSANRYMNFYSAAGSWIFSEEPLIKNSFPALSIGKIRLSYGTAGNDQIPDYAYLSLYQNIQTDIQYQSSIGMSPTGHSNPYLQWELTKKLNLGMDIGFLNNQILFTGNIYINRSSNQLLNYPLSIITGFQGVNKNLDATIENKGIELQLETTPIRRKNFSWNLSTNISFNKNKLIKFTDLDKSTFSQTYVIGQPTNISKVYPYIDVSPQTGLYEYRSADGKLTSSPNYLKDRTMLIDINPKYFGSISSTITFKGFTIDLLFQFVKKMALTNRLQLGLLGSMRAYPAVVEDRWHKPGDIATYQKASILDPNAYTAYNSMYYSSGAYEDASYISLRNLSISYAIPQSALKKLKLNSVRLFVQGQNIFTISSYFGISPESSSIYVLPPLRMISTGIHLNL
ncbi:SusC/RagA family TonB-linked outer membrane protein [Chitinophaga sp. G-6-1-13]|uniref:SusC/RagA family TonB-linked outer membrane protein n=1 Tax=Chitinophaga fulva TaxID=2728842 RepID=A0A848GRX7_9BACT|nr:SusC/RagA family TonB-linked outer membrane protein [Chitinophaga fulva]NML40777.1 SusC/RagA family TonB-linked outer membrane protein [Chitinophaga fulva]